MLLYICLVLATERDAPTSAAKVTNVIKVATKVTNVIKVATKVTNVIKVATPRLGNMLSKILIATQPFCTNNKKLRFICI